MKTSALKISGSWLIEFQKFEDSRGYFYESFKEEDFQKQIGRPLSIKQTNTSSSSKGSVRGIHYALVPPSQAKLVQCQRGSIKDYVIDIRVGSPTFSEFEEIELNEKSETRRLLVKPGLTGLWQVSGRSELDWEDAVRLDLYYVENWSLTLDILIIIRTAAAVWRGEGAY